jgi:hypothetical protein
MLDVAGPFVGDVALELGGFAGTDAFGYDDARAQGEVVGVFVLKGSASMSGRSLS